MSLVSARFTVKLCQTWSFADGLNPRYNSWIVFPITGTCAQTFRASRIPPKIPISGSATAYSWVSTNPTLTTRSGVWSNQNGRKLSKETKWNNCSTRTILFRVRSSVILRPSHKRNVYHNRKFSGSSLYHFIVGPFIKPNLAIILIEWVIRQNTLRWSTVINYKKMLLINRVIGTWTECVAVCSAL